MQPTANFDVTHEPKRASVGYADSRVRWWLLSGVGLGIVVLLVYPFSIDGRAWGALFNFAHAPTFFCTFLLIAAILDASCVGLTTRSVPIVTLNLRRILLLAAILLVGGVACEIAQRFVERQSSLTDAAANAGGIFAAVLYCGLFRISGVWRWFAFPPLIVFFLILPSVQPLSELIECYRQSHEFPLMASFERPAELAAWRARGATATRDTTWATAGKYSIKLRAQSTKTVRFTMCWPIKDWTGYSQLQVDVFNPTDSNLNLGITIGDLIHQSSKSDPAERFSTSVTVDPHGIETVSIDLRDIEAGPADRSLSMTEITMLNFFQLAPTEDAVFHLDNLRLIP